MAALFAALPKMYELKKKKKIIIMNFSRCYNNIVLLENDRKRNVFSTIRFISSLMVDVGPFPLVLPVLCGILGQSRRKNNLHDIICLSVVQLLGTVHLISTPLLLFHVS